MLYLRKAEDRGLTLTPWLKSWHTFSFAHYYDPAFTGFSHLRVLNEDTVQPQSGFETHKHRDMEIISYCLSGNLTHTDDLEGKQVLAAGEIQCMTAGTGIMHSEMNASPDDACHFWQIWVLPHTKGLTPSYQQKKLLLPTNAIIPIASGEPSEELLLIHQDAVVHLGVLNKDRTETLQLKPPRIQWLQIISGEMMVNDSKLKASDGLAILEEEKLTVIALTDCQFILFDLG